MNDQAASSSQSDSSLNLVFLSIFLLIIVSFGTYFFLRSKQVQQTPSAPVETSQESESLILSPVSSWEQYSNSQHSFSFKYPLEIFQYQVDSTTNYQYWGSSDPENSSDQEVWMGMRFSTIDPIAIPIYQNIISQEIDSLDKNKAIIKLSNLSQAGYIGATYYQGMSSDYFEYSEKPNHSYQAFWQKDTQLFQLSINAKTNQDLEKYREVFDKIVASSKLSN